MNGVAAYWQATQYYMVKLRIVGASVTNAVNNDDLRIINYNTSNNCPLVGVEEEMKLYYDCPLEAAYMAKWFGVIYRKGNNVFKWNIDKDLFCVHELPPFYIHEDSLPIFELRLGDIATRGPKHKWSFHVYPFILKQRAANPELWPDIRIIQRNNRAFIMPKQENGE